MTAFRIRPATPADLPAILTVESAAFSTPWSPATFEALLHREGVIFRLLERVPLASEPEGAEVDIGGTEPAEIVGHGILWVVGPEAEVANVAVLPAHRGLGAGALLLDALLAEAGIRGARTVFLEVRVSNTPARRLYASRGFQEVGVRRRYYRAPVEDAHVLALELEAQVGEADRSCGADPSGTLFRTGAPGSEAGNI